MGFVMLIIQVLISLILPVWIYLWFNKHIKNQISAYMGVQHQDLHFVLKRWWATWCVSKKKRAERRKHLKTAEKHGFISFVKPHLETPIILKDDDSCDTVSFYASDHNKNSLLVKLTRRGYRTAEVSLELTLENGQIYVLPDHPNTVIVDNVSSGWAAKDLRIECLEPQQRWRVMYNGMLCDRAQKKKEKSIQHMRLNGIFIASSRTLEWPDDWSPRLHADILARQPWRSPHWIDNILLDYTGFDQWGSIIAQVVHPDSTTNELFLRGLCQRRWGRHESHEFLKTVSFVGVTEGGFMYCIGASLSKNGPTHMRFGHVKEANETVHDIDWTDLNLNKFTNSMLTTCSEHKVNFTANGKNYHAIMKSCASTATVLYSGQPWNWSTHTHNLTIDLNGQTGVGLMQFQCPYNGPSKTKVSTVKVHHFVDSEGNGRTDEYVVPFNERKCQNESLVGGKGYSLALLTSTKDGDFTVPQGFCVTIHALDLQLKSNDGLMKIINNIEKISSGMSEDDLQKCCEKAVSIIESTQVVDPVKKAVVNAIECLESNGNNNVEYRYAIRSSAVGEDSEETSAAGQNSTFLGIRGANEVVEKVAACWASLFSYQSVEYRRQNGMPIKASMGVCVQKMVNADAAGVMFTRHPTTGDPSRILITANYGLGESVVSGSVEPDTIIIQRKTDNEVAIETSMLGSKTEKILVNDDGVEAMVLTEADSKRLSISDEIALRLAKVGIHLELAFGAARDIEWAVIGEQIFLLQARPITTLNAWTDFELQHELGSGVPSSKDVLSFANLGEVYPDPISPLTITTIIRSLNASIGMQFDEYEPPYLFMVDMRCCVNYLGSMMRIVTKTITTMNKIVDIAICGHAVITPELHELAIARNGITSAKLQVRQSMIAFKDAWDNEATAKRAQNVHANCDLNPEDFSHASSLYHEICKKFEDFYKISLCHTHTSRVSVTYQALCMSMLTANYSDFTADHFTDISTLLSSCSDVISSQVPIALRKMSQCIRESGKAEEFTNIEPSEAIEWLKLNCPTAAEQFDTFLKTHGHRCVQELDLVTEPWALKPNDLISTIQTLSMSSNKSPTAKEVSAEDTVEALKTPINGFTKWLLRKVIPLSRTAVNRREMTKALLVSIIFKLKLAYRKLGTLMVLEGRLPAKDLIFYLTHHEIGQLLNGRNPTLIRKAVRRRRIQAQLAHLQYPEVNIGLPKPVQVVSEAAVRGDSVKIEGTSVCGGSILGRACVITNLSEAKLIKQGDILITHSTDIGWSPYFPLLGGIATELGGLISHGAVVAREYGLPCIVGANGATKVFETGDTVLLVAAAGTLQLVQKAEA